MPRSPRRCHLIPLLLLLSPCRHASGSRQLPLHKFGVTVKSLDLAKKYGLIETIDKDLEASSCKLILTENESDGAIELEWTAESKVKQLPFRIDFSSGTSAQRQKQAKSELVCKAVGNSRYVVDLTAGLGRDSFILASAGYSVHMIERNPVLYLLLRDAITRLHAIDSEVAKRMILHEKDSCGLQSIGDIISGDNNVLVQADEPIAVYLDPMYQPNLVGKKSSVKKETQMLHHLVSPAEGSQEENNKSLLDSALKLATTKIVVKRPLKSPPLANAKPHGCVEGSTQRFDLYFMNQKVTYL